MGNTFRYALLLARRWMWLLALGVVIFGSATYLLGTILHPQYQASAYLIVETNLSAHTGTAEDGSQALLKLAQQVTTPEVLEPVVAERADMSTRDLASMISVQAPKNTQIIELDVQARNPQLAADLANQVSQSFVRYAKNSFADTLQIIPATPPTIQAQPQLLEVSAIGATVGLLLAILFIVLFEWIRNLATGVEQIQELLGTEIMTMVPRTPDTQQFSSAYSVNEEKYHMICASLNVAQAHKAFKLVMFTSALEGEGKSTIASQVAMNLAQSGKRVLLIDINIHHPVLAQRFQLSNQVGLTDLLLSESELLPIEYYCQATRVPGLYILPAGTKKLNSAEFIQLLTTEQFFVHLRQASFDYILLDAPSLFSVAETQIMATSIEALVLVVNNACTPRHVLAQTRQLLWQLQTRLLGVIVNQSSWRDYADTHPYTLTTDEQEDEQFMPEPVTAELPAMTLKVLAVTDEPISKPELTRLAGMGETLLLQAVAPEPTPSPGGIGETDPLKPAVSEYVIRPSLSLSGLALPTNGLTRRTFTTDTMQDIPQSTQRS